MAVPTIGAGYKLQYCATQEGSYINLASIEDVKPGASTVEEITVQTADSPTVNGIPYGTKFSGWGNVEDWNFTLVYDPVVRQTLDGLLGDTLYWKFLRPDGASTSAFQAFIKKLGDEVPLKTEMKSVVTLAVNGAAPFTS